jgi:hypothetical protein
MALEMYSAPWVLAPGIATNKSPGWQSAVFMVMPVKLASSEGVAKPK